MRRWWRGDNIEHMDLRVWGAAGMHTRFRPICLLAGRAGREQSITRRSYMADSHVRNCCDGAQDPG